MEPHSNANTGTVNKFRWGMLGNPASSPSSSKSSLTWDDFDHSQTLNLGYSNSTSIVFQRKSFAPYILRFCDNSNLTEERKLLTDIAQPNTPLLATRFVFKYGKQHFVGSSLSDMSLADIIDSTIALEEMHVSAILKQVCTSRDRRLILLLIMDLIAYALQHIHTKSAKSGARINYASLLACNVFVRRDGVVELAAFGNKVLPKSITEKNFHQDRHDLGKLAKHMMSLSEAEPKSEVARQRMISISNLAYGVEFNNFEPSPELMDFLELCEKRGAMEQAVRKHPFLNQGSRESLACLVLNAERCVARRCLRASK
ncbi:uncharacterized protein PAC_05605 [Phialocephala subalpina]|uniref:Protein kinase domain-containing protein n=1 Tax=Phialocephala subalpina TaxID=576137 RepID=A0A1L7WSH5_9HELO|nr:uncharacterized protein PAC_05605 [Phialocephala subalpina]